MDDASRRTIIVDYDSLRGQLARWYENGELRQARAIADSIPNELDRILRRLGRQYGESGRRTMASLKDYSDRRLLLAADPVGGAGVDGAVVAFERAGFRRFVNPARRRTGSLLMEVMRDVLEDRRPRELVIATADPDVVDVVHLLRPVGVLTGLICVLNAPRTEQIRGVPDGLVDLRDIADALGIRIQGGFDLTEGDPAVEALELILSRAGIAQWLSLEGVFNELESELSRAPSDADGGDEDGDADVAERDEWGRPRRDAGRRRYLESALELMTTQRWRIAPDGSGILNDTALARIAVEGQRLARDDWPADGLQKLHSTTIRSGATPENSWLGHGTFADLLRGARAHLDGDWKMPADGLLDKLLEQQLLQPTTDDEPDARESALLDVAQFVGERLNASDSALTLVALANDAPQAIGVSAEDGWAGRGSFLELIRQANRRHAGDAWILDTDIPPGFIRLRRHRRPTEELGKQGGSGAHSQLRTVVPAFPTDDEQQFLLRAAVLATVLTRMNVIEIAGETGPFSISGEARDLSGRTTGLTGRQAFSFLLKSLLSGDPRAQGVWAPELRLVQVTDEVSGKEPWKVSRSGPSGSDEEPLLGTRALLRIVSENFQRYLAAQGYGARYQKEAELRLGPSNEEDARGRFPDVFDRQRLDDEYRQFRVRYERPKGDGSVMLGATLMESSMERNLLLTRTGPAGRNADAGSQLDNLGDRVMRHIVELDAADEGVTLRELHQALVTDSPELHPLDLARVLSRGGQADGVSWRIHPGLPYSRIRPSTSAQLALDSRPVGEKHWFEHSKTFWTSLIDRRDPIPVSWIEAARSVIRVEG